MAKELLVVAVDNSLKQLDEYSKYFNSPAMQLFGIKPTYVGVSNIESLSKALKNKQRPGLLLIDGNLDNGMTWENAVNANTSISIGSKEVTELLEPLEMIILSSDKRVVAEAKKQGYIAAPKSVYKHALNDILREYGLGIVKEKIQMP